jgi:hypothetical protein
MEAGVSVLHLGPVQTSMAVQVFLKPGFQCREQLFPLFWRQLLFIALHIVHGFKKPKGGHEFHEFSQINSC